MSGKKIVAGMREAVERAKQDVADVVAIHKEAYRAGWIAGREAAAGEACRWQGLKGRAVAEKIRNMEPPA